MNLDQFEELAKRRRSVRHFKPDPLPEGLLERLLDIAHWAPSGYNLQPAHFIIVTDEELKAKLHPACMNQKQILEAPATVVFSGDKRVVENHFEKIVAQEKEAGAMNEGYEKFLRKYIPLGFEQGPSGIGWIWKKIAPPFMRPFSPVPSMPAVEKRYWLSKQVMLAAMVFMLSATAAGLSTVPMEGFDETWVRKALGIPSSHIVPVVIPVGYADDSEQIKTRLPVKELIHINGW